MRRASHDGSEGEGEVGGGGDDSGDDALGVDIRTLTINIV